jgi:hypothetical protein
MSNPTTPFSWQMPTATDLVTDLPADFEVFGQAVATSMADLLGGTSGQILAKNSNTDMDFVWIANDQGDITGVTAGNGISVTDPTGPVPTVAINTAVTADLTTAQTLTNKTLTSPVLTTPSISNINAKADILVGTADNTLGILSVGTNGQVLTADSTVSPSGLKWATASAGGTWTSYTPTLTNITLGNGTMTSFYNNDGKTVNYAFYIKWGSTTSGAGNYSFSIPVAADTTLGDNAVIGTQANGSGVLWDNSASGPYVAQVMLTSSTTCRLFSFDLGTFPAGASQQRASTTTPFTWATNDIIIGFITYKAA